MKKAYKSPRLIAYGKIEEITRGNSSGDRLDQDFNAGTKLADLTFSG